MKRLLLPLLAVLVSACARQPPVPADHFYRLPAPNVHALSRPLTKGVILVSPFQTDGLHNERAMIYTKDAHAITLRRYHYSYWLDAPPRLVQDYLVAYLRAAKAASLVVTDSGVRSALTFSGRIVRLDQQLRGKSSRALIELELRVDGSRSARPLLLKDYRADVPASDGSMEALVLAFHKGLDQIFGRFLTDTRAVLTH